VIGVADAFAEALNQGPQDEGEDGGGQQPTGSIVYTGPSVRTAFSARPVPYTRYHFRLADPSKAADIASRLETAFLENSMVATSTKEQIDTSLAQNQAFNRLFQGFMGLGLMVGVASLGVIAFRAVVERRQSIGMLRALGFRAGMVRAQFLIESSIVTLIGTAMGIGLGTLISWNIVDDISNEIAGLKFSIPWAQVAGIVLVALAFSLLMTWAPARQASKIYPSEALRYE
jgi:putative ABC transport system permease protein